MKGCVAQEKHDFFCDFEYQQYGRFDNLEIKNALIEAGRLNLHTLVLDLDSGPPGAVLEALHAYRIVRPNTRIVILAVGRKPGDKTVAALVGMGIYDIVAPEPHEDPISALRLALQNPSPTYAQAARWTVKTQDEPEQKEPFWNRLRAKKKGGESKPAKFKPVKESGSDQALDETRDDEIGTEQKPIPKQKKQLFQHLKKKTTLPRQKTEPVVVKQLNNEPIDAQDNHTNRDSRFSFLAQATSTIKTASSLSGTLLSITYHFIKLCFFIALTVGLIAGMIWAVGVIASIFPEPNRFMTALIQASDYIAEFVLSLRL